MFQSFLFLMIAIALVGCNTMEGLGRDVKKGGESLERAAEEHKPLHRKAHNEP
jgi:entericidin B